MYSRIETLKQKKLVGNRIRMCFSKNKTFELWQGFMGRRKEITNAIGSDLFSVEVYDRSFFTDFNTDKEFEKWAAVEVSNYDTVPDGMEKLILREGLYAVFIHRGPASEGEKTYSYIFRTWLPASGFQLDSRPHLAIMGAKYKKNDPASEEELWIPVQSKT